MFIAECTAEPVKGAGGTSMKGLAVRERHLSVLRWARFNSPFQKVVTQDEPFSSRIVEKMATKVHNLQEMTSPGVADGQLTDEMLLAAYRQSGDRSKFEELVRRYERELYNYLRRFLGDAEQAEDVFQVTFLMVHLKCEQFETGRRFRPWLYAVATNAAIDFQRREKRHRAVSLDRNRKAPNGTEEPRLAELLLSGEPGPLAEASRLESGEWVQDALDGLTDQMRDVVNLVYFQGLKYREAAEVLKVPVGTIKSRMNAAVNKLYEHWKATHAG
jgi:RNA polymerase sigma-70 factor (ECF subfamily)